MTVGNQQEMVKTLADWRNRAESMMRLSPKAAGTREMRVNASKLLELIAEFESTQTKGAQPSDSPVYTAPKSASILNRPAHHMRHFRAEISAAASSASY